MSLQDMVLNLIRTHPHSVPVRLRVIESIRRRNNSVCAESKIGPTQTTSSTATERHARYTAIRIYNNRVWLGRGLLAESRRILLANAGTARLPYGGRRLAD